MKVWIQIDDPIIAGKGFVQIAAHSENIAEVIMSFEVIGLKGKRAPEALDPQIA